MGDTDGNGVLTKDEFKKLVLELPASRPSYESHKPKDAITRLFEMADKNGDGVLTKEEFTRLVVDPPSPRPSAPSDAITRLFNMGDANSDGVLTKEEFAKLITEPHLTPPKEILHEPSVREPSKDAIGRLFDRGDINSDGVLTRDEFTKLVMDSQGRIGVTSMTEAMDIDLKRIAEDNIVSGSGQQSKGGYVDSSALSHFEEAESARMTELKESRAKAKSRLQAKLAQRRAAVKTTLV
jgi:Ca2+-binding EF-hand superfamily protein